MIRSIEPISLLQQRSVTPVIDVRSPGEFSQGHIPGAVSIPVFSDAERAVVGTLYVQSGREDAILKGLDLALPHTDNYLFSLGKASPASGMILLHCWRGGLRSALMAELFSKAGHEVLLLTGGYKAYRRFIRDNVARPARIIVLGGLTGSGKTELLHAIAARGEQVIDLEALACHKGSVFGALGQPAQPTNEQFENNLYDCWSKLDFSRLIWMEDESRMIGKVTLPDSYVELMNHGMLIRVDLDVRMRISRIVREYSGFDHEYLADSINRIHERLGGARANEAMAALAKGCYDEVAAITLSYYDRAYLFSMERRKISNVHGIEISGTNTESDASRIIELAYRHA